MGGPVSSATNPYLFVSYSRAQLGMAESLALTAVEYGVQVWFDLLALTPGVAWHANLLAGLRNAGGTVLLVSRQSLASKPVADEVQESLAAKKPLYLLLTEAVDLKLRHAPALDLAGAAHSVIDVRANFHRGFERLMAAFRTGEPCRDPLPRPNPLGIATVLPRAVAVVAGALALPALELLAMCLLWLSGGIRWDHLRWADSLACITALNLVMLATCAAWQVAIIIGLLQRKMRVEQMLNGLLSCDLVLAYEVVWQRLYLPDNPLLSGRAVVSGWHAYLLPGAALAATALVLYQVFASLDLCHWLPPGFAGGFRPGGWRQVERVTELVKATQQRARGIIDTRPYFYELHCSLADEPIVRLVRAIMRKHNISEREAPVELPKPVLGAFTGTPVGNLPLRVDLDILLVTGRLPEATFRKVLASHKGYLIAILAAPVQLPPDLENVLGKLQWIEFRDLNVARIGFMIMGLRGFQPAKASYAAWYLPAQPEALKGPISIPELSIFLRGCGAVSAACGAFALIARGVLPPGTGLLPWAIVLGAWQLVMVHCLYRRSLSFGPFALQLVASFLLEAVAGVPTLLIVFFGRQKFLRVGVPGLFDPLYLLIVGGLWAVLVAFSLWQLRTKWLPVPAPSPDGPVLQTPGHLAIARGHIVYLLLALMSLAYFVVVQPR
jgi:hypothetical protein